MNNHYLIKARRRRDIAVTVMSFGHHIPTRRPRQKSSAFAGLLSKLSLRLAA